MSTIWIGGNPHEPDYYIYTQKIGTNIAIPRKWFWSKIKYHTKWKEETIIITRDEYEFFNKHEQEKCKPAKLSDIKKYGSKLLAKQAEYQIAQKMSGFNF